jgi:hypothetical protein
VIWVEGDTDHRFFEKVVRPQLSPAYDQVLVLMYRQKKTSDINKLLTAMSHQGFAHLFIADMDAAPCITVRKSRLRERYPSVKDDEIIVVCKEIESWYLAGLSANGASTLKVAVPGATDQVTKRIWRHDNHGDLTRRFEFLIELLNNFDITTACLRNQSFAYLRRKLGL